MRFSFGKVLVQVLVVAVFIPAIQGMQQINAFNNIISNIMVVISDYNSVFYPYCCFLDTVVCSIAFI